MPKNPRSETLIKAFTKTVRAHDKACPGLDVPDDIVDLGIISNFIALQILCTFGGDTKRARKDWRAASRLIKRYIKKPEDWARDLRVF
jgi:hypothetical protein